MDCSSNGEKLGQKLWQYVSFQKFLNGKPNEDQNKKDNKNSVFLFICIVFWVFGTWTFNTWFTYGVTEINFEIPLIQAVLVHTINWP